jgi:hAT family C-terminal dimerisation region
VVLMLVMPAMSATAERSFSAIRRLTNYIRSTIGQERLNSVMLFNIYDKHADEINFCDVARDFVALNENRRSVLELI